jgi:tRNA(Arg) A34 adenosine deaminase TadA
MSPQEIKYPYLPEGRTIEYVSGDHPHMRAAREVMRARSTDWGFPTGAVVVLDGSVIGGAANRSRLANRTLLHLHKKGWCFRKALHVPSGKRYWMCPGCAGPEYHAEILAVKDAVKDNNSANGASLYLYGHWWCCESCWVAMMSAGIEHVYLVEGSERLFDRSASNNIIGLEFEI